MIPWYHAVGLVVILTLPVLLFIFVFRTLLFRTPGGATPTVVHGVGFSENRVAYFIRCFDSFPSGSTAAIVGGEATNEVWRPEVFDAIERASNRGVTTKFVCGPLVVGERDPQTGRLRSRLLDLAAAGKVKLYVSATRQPFHFRVASTGRTYYEDPHAPGSGQLRTGYNIPANPFEAAGLWKRFRKTLRDKRVRESTDPYGDFVVATEEELAAIFRRRGASYGTLRKIDLEGDLREIRQCDRDGVGGWAAPKA